MSDDKNLRDAAIGAGLGVGVGLGGVLLMRPGLRRALAHSVKNFGKGGSRAAAAAEKIPAEVLREADDVGRALRNAGIDPSKARIGIVATPGTGKSTMARALEQRLGVKNLSLDKAPSGGLRGDRATRYLARDHGGQVPAGSILEQTYLPHSADLDQFDAVIHLQRDTPDVLSSILKRGKGAHQADYVNYSVLKDQIAEGFNALQGRTLSRGGRATIKVRPEGGTFNAAQGRLERARQLGLDVERFSRLTQAQQLDSLARKKIKSTYGVTSSYRRGRLAADAGLILGGGAVGALTYRSMGKEAAMDLTDKQKKSVAVGAGVGLGAAALLALARRPGLRAHLRAKGKSFFSSGEQKRLAELNISRDVPKESVEHARRIIRDLRRQGYSTQQIKKMRIGVVGSSGSGKSSLARAIEQELGHTRLSLDEFVSYNPLKAGNVDIERGLKTKGGMKPGMVAEQTQLLHSGDPSNFDLLVKVERPAKDIREGLLQRGHAAVTADYTDFTKAQRSVNEAFHTAGGTHRNIGNGVEIRVQPRGGKDAAARRVARARELGLNVDEFKTLSQRDQIQSLARGRMTRRQSFRAHISSGALGQDVAAGGGLVLAGGATGALMSRESEKTASQDPFDRVTPPVKTKSLSEILHDLRELDTPEKWYAYVDRHHNPHAEQRPVLERARRGKKSRR